MYWVLITAYYPCRYVKDHCYLATVLLERASKQYHTAGALFQIKLAEHKLKAIKAWVR